MTYTHSINDRGSDLKFLTLADASLESVRARGKDSGMRGQHNRSLLQDSVAMLDLQLIDDLLTSQTVRGAEERGRLIRIDVHHDVRLHSKVKP